MSIERYLTSVIVLGSFTEQHISHIISERVRYLCIFSQQLHYIFILLNPAFCTVGRNESRPIVASRSFYTIKLLNISKHKIYHYRQTRDISFISFSSYLLGCSPKIFAETLTAAFCCSVTVHFVPVISIPQKCICGLFLVAISTK
jgi:hypothetical protein